MKKYTKVIGIFLCLAVLIGMLSVASSANSNAPTGLVAIDAANITPYIGCYTEDADVLGHLNDAGDADLLIDGDFTNGGTAWIECTDCCDPVVALLELNAPMDLTRIEIYRANENQYINDFTVEYKNADGTWEKLVDIVDVPYIDNKIMIGSEFTAAAVRIVVNDYVGSVPQIAEIVLYEGYEAPPTEAPTEAPTQAPTQAPAQDAFTPTVPSGTAPSLPTGETWLQLIKESTITPYVGYFVNGNFNTLTDINDEESPLLTNANVGNNTWINGATFPVPSGKVPGAMLDLGGFKVLGGLELVGAAGDRITSFDIAVLDANGVWQDVYSTTEAPYVGSTLKIEFAQPVVGSAIRVIINGWENAHPILKEIFVYEATSDKMVEVPVINATASQNPLREDMGIENAVDGDLFSYYQIGPQNMPVIVNLDTTKADGTPTNVSRMVIFGYVHNRYAPKDIVVEVKTEGDVWTTIYSGVAYNLNFTDTFVLDFPATYAAYDVRLTVTSYTANNLILNEIKLYDNGETATTPVAPAPTDPTNPTEPAGSEPATEPSAPTTDDGIPVVVPGTTTPVNGIVKEGDTYKKIDFKKVTTQFGFYNASGAFVDKNDGYCVTDGWYDRAGYSECTSADGQIALIMTLNETKTIGRIEIVTRAGYPNNAPEKFDVQALIDGQWQTVVSVTENAFTDNNTVAYAFPAVETNQIRILVNKVVGANEQCYLSEVELYEVTTGKLYNDITLVGQLKDNNAFGNNPATNFIDGNKATNTTGSNFTINLTDANGQPTSIDGYRLFMNRGTNLFANNVNLMVQLTPGGAFESVGSFPTGFTSSYPCEVCIVELDKTYDVYAVQVNLDAAGPVNEFELFQYQKDENPDGPVDPTEPTEPSAPATEPSAPATQPSVPTTEPSVPGDDDDIYDEFDMTEIEATFEIIGQLDPDAYTEESLEELALAVEQALLILLDENLTQEMIDEANEMLVTALANLVAIDAPGDDLPELPELPVNPVIPNTQELFATIAIISNLNPAEYTTDSYAALIEAADIVNAMISGANGFFTQELLDEANAILTEALNGLVTIGGGTPGGNVPGGDDDLPADTGDVAMTILSGMMTLSAIGGAVVIGKKKFF